MDLAERIKELEIILENKINEFQVLNERLQKLKNIQKVVNSMDEDNEIKLYIKEKLKSRDENSEISL